MRIIHNIEYFQFGDWSHEARKSYVLRLILSYSLVPEPVECIILFKLRFMFSIPTALANGTHKKHADL